MIQLYPTRAPSVGDRRVMTISAFDEYGVESNVDGIITATHYPPVGSEVSLTVTPVSGAFDGYTISILFALAGAHRIRIARTDSGNELADNFIIEVEP